MSPLLWFLDLSQNLAYFILITWAICSEPWKRPSFSSIMESLRPLIKSSSTTQSGHGDMPLLTWVVWTPFTFRCTLVIFTRFCIWQEWCSSNQVCSCSKNTNRVCILCMLFHLTVLCWIWSFIWTCAWCNPVCSKESTAFFRWFIEYFMWNWFVRISMFIIVKNLVRYFFPFMKRQRKREETNNFGILIL